MHFENEKSFSTNICLTVAHYFYSLLLFFVRIHLENTINHIQLYTAVCRIILCIQPVKQQLYHLLPLHTQQCRLFLLPRAPVPQTQNQVATALSYV